MVTSDRDTTPSLMSGTITPAITISGPGVTLRLSPATSITID